uniref:Uncharacterized protein LOC104214063 n=1 Tax=Nicotiana sylvestris TaxID=4096 RepID=A0A1U7VJF8_NICSY|nr:PREDICTED: uncharacterized protein LOC104214063 [Nicotiana sylvestris]
MLAELAEDAASSGSGDEQAYFPPPPMEIPLNLDGFMNLLEIPCSSTNIIRLRVIEQLGLLDQIVPASRVLNGFNTAIKTTKGETTLPVSMDGTAQNVKLHVIERDMKYYALSRRPRIHCMGTAPSTLHQMMKFLIEDGVKTIYGEQHTTREAFAVRNEAPIPISPLSKEPTDNQTASSDKPD